MSKFLMSACQPVFRLAPRVSRGLPPEGFPSQVTRPPRPWNDEALFASGPGMTMAVVGPSRSDPAWLIEGRQAPWGDGGGEVW
jgi:hypothetical protein